MNEVGDQEDPSEKMSLYLALAKLEGRVFQREGLANAKILMEI